MDNHKFSLIANNLSKSYNKQPVIKDITIKLKSGEAVGLLGPNGAGKTTCFYMLCGLIKPDHGSITLDNQSITHLPMYRRARMGIGYLPQESSIFRGLNIEDNILAILELSEKDPSKIRNSLEQLLAEFSISHLRKARPITLSGGERRRVEVARSIAANPKFILLDEPLAGIDPIAIADIKNLIAHLKDRNIGVLITDHNVRETLGIITRAYVIYDGCVLLEDTATNIVKSKAVKKVYLGENFA